MGVLSEKRKGRVTASAIGAIMGVNPYQSRDDVLRRMVRDHFGAEPEFTGNAATQHGHDHEAIAIEDYEIQNGVEVQQDPDFVVHPEFDWLGCTPDGLIYDDGLIEVKCPYHAKKPYTLADKEFYKLQCYLQLVVTDREYLDFYCWTPNEQHQERVFLAGAKLWFVNSYNEIESFYKKYLETISDEKKAQPYLEDLEVDLSHDEEWLSNAAEYAEAKAEFEAAKERMDSAKASLLAIAKGQDRKCTGGGVMAYKSERKGNVNYKKVPELKGVDLDGYRGKSITVWTVK
jgi:putative phage-type endonuclease